MFKQKRKKFDSVKARIEGTEIAQFVKMNRRNKTTTSAPTQKVIPGGTAVRNLDPRISGMPKWKAESLAFRAAIRAAKQTSTPAPTAQQGRGGKGTSTTKYGSGIGAGAGRGVGGAGRARAPVGRQQPMASDYEAAASAAPYVDPSFIRCNNCKSDATSFGICTLYA